MHTRVSPGKGPRGGRDLLGETRFGDAWGPLPALRERLRVPNPHETRAPTKNRRSQTPGTEGICHADGRGPPSRLRRAMGCRGPAVWGRTEDPAGCLISGVSGTLCKDWFAGFLHRGALRQRETARPSLQRASIQPGTCGRGTKRGPCRGVPLGTAGRPIFKVRKIKTLNMYVFKSTSRYSGRVGECSSGCWDNQEMLNQETARGNDNTGNTKENTPGTAQSPEAVGCARELEYGSQR